MKTRNVFLGMALCLLLTNCSNDSNCLNGSHESKSKTLKVESFTGIDFRIAGDVKICQGSSQSVKVLGNSNVINEIATKVSGGTWIIDFGSKCFDDYDLSLEITVPNLREVVLSGSGNIEIQDFKNQSDLELAISGSGEIQLNNFEGCKNLSAKIRGHGDIYALKPLLNVEQINISIPGSGSYDAFPIETDKCKITINGSGDCYVSVANKLDVSISGSGSVYYKGSPTVDQNITGSGKVLSRN